MSLFEKILRIYQSLSNKDFDSFLGTIVLQNDSDGKGDYIKEWNHPTLAKPTQAQIDEITD